IAGDDGDRRRRRLRDHLAVVTGRLRAAGLLPHLPEGPILPVILGSEARALAASAALRTRGCFVPAIRPPTVPPGSARLPLPWPSHPPPAALARLVHALLETTR